MDWRGRQLSDYIQTALFVLISVLSLAIGILKEDVTLVFKSSVAGCALVILICVPDWWVFNRNPFPWRPKGFPDEAEPASVEKLTQADSVPDSAPRKKDKRRKKV